jgi:hypothetical protein
MNPWPNHSLEPTPNGQRDAALDCGHRSAMTLCYAQLCEAASGARVMPLLLNTNGNKSAHGEVLPAVPVSS